MKSKELFIKPHYTEQDVINTMITLDRARKVAFTKWLKSKFIASFILCFFIGYHSYIPLGLDKLIENHFFAVFFISVAIPLFFCPVSLWYKKATFGMSEAVLRSSLTDKQKINASEEKIDAIDLYCVEAIKNKNWQEAGQ